MKPNIVIVIADDTTPSYHGCYGGPTPTPNIDTIAREGIRFERGYCCSSLCCPSRWNLFTGQHTGRSRWVYRDVPEDEPYLVSQNGMLDPETPTLAKVLREAGYFTGHIGKWHSRFNTADFEFEEPTFYNGDPDDPRVEAEIRRRQTNAREVVRRCAGFEYVDCVNWGNLGGADDPRMRAHNPMWMTDGALEFLEAAAEDGRPFYLHLANTVPHSPDCTESLRKDHRYTWGGVLEEPPSSHPPDDTVPERMREAGLQTEGPIAGVNAGMVMLDDQVGAVLRRLNELGLAEDTIVVYTADHGIPGKGSAHVTGQHLPFVMRWPAGLPTGRVVHDIFSWVDMVPTLCDACGVSMPKDHTVDGVSVLAALRGRADWPRRVAYHAMGWSRSVIKGRYHYIATRYPDSAVEAFESGDEEVKPGIGLMFDRLNAPFIPDYFEPDQLYDLATDPFERVNLVDDPTRADVLADMKRELWRVADTMPRPFPREPHPFRQTDRYRELLARRREEMDAVDHYPPDIYVPRAWFANLHDPGASSEE